MAARNYRGKLRNKTFFLMAVVGIVPIAVAAFLTQYVVTNAHRDDVAKLESAVLREKASEVQNFIDQSILAHTQIVVPYAQSLTIATSAQAYALSATLTALPFLRSESFLDLQGKETMRADRTHFNGYPPSALGDLSASPGFAAAKAGGYYLGPVSYDNGIPVVSFASPVKSDSGEIIGVVSGVAGLDNIQAIVAEAKIGDTGYLYLVDQSGALIGGGSFAKQSGATSTASEDIVARVITGNNLLTPATQMRYTNVAGVSVVAGGLVMPEYGASWGLIAEWPTAEADAVTSALLVRNIIVLIVVLLAVIVLSIFAALFLTRPIKELEGGTERVAQGKFDESVSIKTGDELEELGDSFNTMMVKLKELEQLKDEFVFIAAHELRTPVAAMKGYLTLILDGTTGGVTDATRAFIEKVLASNQRLIQLVNDLLEVARSQAGRLTIKVAPIAIVPPIRSVLDELKSLADEKSVALHYDPPAEVPNVLADADRVKEVVVNLIGNAIKYMGGAGAVTITHEQKDHMLVTHVTDTGLGISKEAQARLFEKFYRVQTDQTKDITGTGLGLFIVKQIVEKMDGKIWIESEEGKGSTFSFSLVLAS